jgi:hypothetical protein
MNDGIASLYSTLVSGNAGDEGPDLNGVFDAAFSLIGDTTSAEITDLGNNFFDVDPLLGPLRNNGGPSMTHALLPGSPAVDMGVANLYGSDQRGMSRVVTITNEETPGGGADIGAFELQSRELLFAAGRETAKRLSGIAAAQAGIDDVARHKAVRRSALTRNRAPWNLSP